jgi:60 kDa SS-A/Ro ribonucleoprotein
MSSKYLLQHGGTKNTPQSEPMRADQVKNEAGGYGWEVDNWSKLRRFLILGSEGGSYYVGERQLTQQNIGALAACLKEDGPRTVGEIAAISHEGRAPKNDQALYALAYAISHGDKETKRAAAEALPDVARITTHLYSFVAYAETMRGWGRTMRWAVSHWFDRKPEQLAYHAIKYRQRDGWAQRDPLRLAHPSFDDAALRDVVGFMSGNVDHKHLVNYTDKDGKTHPIHRPAKPWSASEDTDKMILGYLAATKAESAKESADLVREYKLPREALKTEHLNSTEVWGALLETGMPMHALIRNLATMTRNGTLEDSALLKLVIDQLGDGEYIRKSRVHPIAVLFALRTYAQGRGYQSRGEGWTPKPKITDALDAAFYTAFGNVEPTNKKMLLAVDVSGSMMGMGHGIQGVPLSPREAGVAMALITLNVEPDVEVVGFDTAVYAAGISSRQRLDDALNSFPRTGGGTDCSLPMQYAIQKNKTFEGFVLYTDHQTWAGNRYHPAQALVEYRNKTGLNARCATVAMVAYAQKINDPQDAGMFDVVGFDAATPGLISEFVSGKL